MNRAIGDVNDTCKNYHKNEKVTNDETFKIEVC
jgi:hypothetical protein